MKEFISSRKLKWEIRKRKVKDTVTQTIHQTKEWCKQNAESVIIATPIIVTGSRSLLHTASSFARKRAVKQEIFDRNTRFYDHRLGCYWHTKRELKPDELRIVTKRRAAGESYGDIFASMKLLK